ncbi:V-set domain-containing T-cell activation inhibitor 1-like isoform X1 [Anabas testudineus]|nr:V-set domain-containing T-cell activation inhibitor 1-like isoform X1 [Anabas testudineus]
MLLLSTLPVTLTGNNTLKCSTEKITVSAADDVILQCRLEPPISAESMRIEWTRPDLLPCIRASVHTHKDGRFLYEEQNPVYNNRSSLFVDQLINGNVSLKVSRVTPSDTGKYRCYLPSIHQEAVIELSVGHDGFVPPDSFMEHKPVEAVVGSDVILPCVSTFNISVDDHILEWNKDDEEIYTVQDGRGSTQVDDYKYRTSVSVEELKKNNVSLKLSGVKETDKGDYCCCIKLDRDNIKCTKVTLEVNKEKKQPEDKQQRNAGADPLFTDSIEALVGIVAVCLLAALVGFVLWKYRRCDRRRPDRTNVDGNLGTNVKRAQLLNLDV